MRVGGRVDAELEEDLGDVRFDGAVGDVETVGDRLVRAAFGDEREYIVLARGERGERVVVAAPAEQAGDDRRVDDGFAVADAAERVDEDGGGEDPLLQQVADLLGVLLRAGAWRSCGSRYCESTSTATSGCSSRIRWAATSPSSVWVGGILMSTIATSGGRRATSRMRRRRRRLGRRRRRRPRRGGARCPRGSAWRRRRRLPARDHRPDTRDPSTASVTAEGTDPVGDMDQVVAARVAAIVDEFDAQLGVRWT